MSDAITSRLYHRWSLMRNWALPDHLLFRTQYIRDIDGDIMPPFICWPRNMRALFFGNDRPISDCGTFQLALFFLGNGGSIDTIGDWILSSYILHHCSDRTIRKRIYQLTWIYHTLLEHPSWRFFNVNRRLMCHFNGQVYNYIFYISLFEYISHFIRPIDSFPPLPSCPPGSPLLTHTFSPHPIYFILDSLFLYLYF